MINGVHTSAKCDGSVNIELGLRIVEVTYFSTTRSIEINTKKIKLYKFKSLNFKKFRLEIMKDNKIK
jgi:hypothetical protein